MTATVKPNLDLLLLKVERAVLARQRYVLLTPKTVFDVAVDNQLANFVILLEDMAVEAGATRAQLDAIETGADDAIREIRREKIAAGTIQL